MFSKVEEVQNARPDPNVLTRFDNKYGFSVEILIAGNALLNAAAFKGGTTLKW